MDWPLGAKEDLTTEFKRADALRDPANIAREAVGFLNADGGLIWIGVGETAGVADAVEAVPEPDREASRLQDALIDLVEPQPVIGGGREIEIEKVPFPGAADRHLLRLRVGAGKRGPYALLRQQGARVFLRRSGSRLHVMSREEIAAAFENASGAANDERKRIDQLEAELRSPPDAGMKVFVRPVSLDLELALTRENLLPLLQSPKATGNRPFGWNFTSRYDVLTPLAGDGYLFGEKGSVQWLEVWPRGDVRFFTSRDRLHWRGEANRLWPFALLEFPVSVARLARTLYANHPRRPVPANAEILLALALQVGGDTLSPYSPNSVAYQFAERGRRLERDGFVTAVLATWSELQESPDRCAYHLIRQTYRAFGFEEEEMPAEFDRERGLLTIPG